jgi:hypothetical protein
MKITTIITMIKVITIARIMMITMMWTFKKITISYWSFNNGLITSGLHLIRPISDTLGLKHPGRETKR